MQWTFLPSFHPLSLLDGGGAGHTHANMMGGGGDASKVSVAISGKWKFNSAVEGGSTHLMGVLPGWDVRSVYRARMKL